MKAKKFPLLILASAVLLGLLIFVARMPWRNNDNLDEYYSLLNQEGETSYDLIEAAYSTGTIDYETSLVYKMYAAFRDASLPTEYQSDLVAYKQGTHIFNEILADYDTLSDETKTLLKPFFLRPDDENSYWNQQYQAGAYTDETAFIPAAHAVRPAANLYTDYLLTADGEAKIWYPNDSIITPLPSGKLGAIVFSANSAKKIAEQIKAILDHDEIIKLYNDYFGKNLLSDAPRGGDELLDIYVAPTGTDLGWTFAEFVPTPTSSYVIMNPAIASKQKVLETTLAHELFHVFQNLFKYDARKDDWWGEATATWSEDFVYPADNTEHGYLKPFMEYAEISLDVPKPPENHMYGAYIFAYFLTQNFGDQLIKDTWYACGDSTCLKALNEIIDGGYKKQWKEFTLWNYNKKPVQNYSDYPSFPKNSSETSSNTENIFLAGVNDLIDFKELKYLTSQVTNTENMVTDSKIKKLTFENLKNFTGQSEYASLKAIIYYKDGREEVEDWTNLEKRSFCIESGDENFEKVVLITSNSDMKNSIPATQIKVKGSNSCYQINQTDSRSATIFFPYSDGGVYKTAPISTNVEIKSLGEPAKDAAETEKFGYQTEWALNYEFEQIRNAFTMECNGSSIDFDSGWTTRDAGIMTFDLSSESLKEGDTFSVDLTFGLPHPKGNEELVPAANVNCIGAYFGGGAVGSYSATVEDIYEGTITNMTADGAKIEIHNACYYGDCSSGTGALFQQMEPITLEIKKKSS